MMPYTATLTVASATPAAISGTKLGFKGKIRSKVGNAVPITVTTPYGTVDLAAGEEFDLNLGTDLNNIQVSAASGSQSLQILGHTDIGWTH
jgi:hypothetical protein